MPKVAFYSHFTRFTKGEKETLVKAEDVREAIASLVVKYGEEFSSRVLKTNGEPREFVRIFLNNKDIRFLGNLDAKTLPEDEVLIVPAAAGG